MRTTIGERERVEDDARELVLRCQRGDEQAFRELYNLYATRIYRHLHLLLGPAEDLEDALQGVFAQAFGKIQTFDFRAKFSTWLHGIAVRVALNSRRSRRRRGHAMDALATELKHDGADHRPSPERQASLSETAERLERHLAELAPEKRIVFALFYLEQLKLDEVAERVGESRVTTWGRIRRARSDLLAAIAREDKTPQRTRGTVP